MHAAVVPRPSLVILSLALLGLAPCPRDGAQPPASREEVQAQMKTHFEEVSRIKDAVIDGDLETAREQASWVAGNERPAHYPVGWRPQVSELIKAAERTADAPDIETAARRTANLAAACGRCHRANNVQPRFPNAMEPELSDDVKAQMERHQWAADRLWEGLVGPDDGAWHRGTELFPPTVCADDFEIDGAIADAMRELCTDIEVLGDQAADAKAPESRVKIYGQLLTTCAACHNVTE